MADKRFSKLDTILKTALGNPLDIYYSLYEEFISRDSDPSMILQRILQFTEKPIGSEDDDAPQLVSMERAQEIERKYYILVRELVRTLALENPTIEDFYEKLYHRIYSSNLFPADGETQAVILKILVEETSEIPYFQAIDLLQMSDDEYREAVNRLDPQFTKAIHMLNRHFASRTEEASQLFRIASELEDKNDQIIYWSLVLSTIKRHHNQTKE